MSSADTSDPQQLLILARRGDREALGKLLELYRRYLKLLVGLQNDAQIRAKFDPSDVIQETFLEAHRDFGQFHGNTEGEFMRWLRRILASNLHDHIKRYRGTQRRDVRLERSLCDQLDRSSLALGQACVAEQSSPSEKAIRREQAVILADAMDRLPDDYRTVLIWRNFKELSFPEVARRMNRSVGSSQQLWMRALAQLRQIMGGQK